MKSISENLHKHILRIRAAKLRKLLALQGEIDNLTKVIEDLEVKIAYETKESN